MQKIKIASNMTTVFIDNSNIQTKSFVEHARSVPFTTVETERKKSFEEAVAECNGITVDAFFDELDKRIKKRFHA